MICAVIASLVLLSNTKFGALSPPSSGYRASTLQIAADSMVSIPDGEGFIAGRIPSRFHSQPLRSLGKPQVFLLPANALSEDLFTAWRSRLLISVEPDLEAHVRLASPDAAGDFRFNRIPDGQYFVYTWAEMVKPSGITVGQVVLFDRIAVRDGKAGDLRLHPLFDP